MGRDKAAVLLAGRTLLDHMLSKMDALGMDAHVAGIATASRPGAMHAVADQQIGCGPMSGLETALRCSQNTLVMLLGIDLPLVSAGFLNGLLRRANMTGALATIPRVTGRPQPLCAVYRRDLAPAVGRMLQAGTLKMMHGVERAIEATGGRLDIFDVENVVAAGNLTLARPAMWEFLNCNTPADLELAERLLQKQAPQALPESDRPHML